MNSLPCRGQNVGVRSVGLRVARAGAMRGERGLGPVVEGAFCGAGDELQGAVVDQANDLRAGGVVKTSRGHNLGDLFAELAVGLKRFFDVVANCGAQPCLQGRSMRRAYASAHIAFPQIRQSVLQCTINSAANAALQVVVGCFFKGGVGGEMGIGPIG